MRFYNLLLRDRSIFFGDTLHHCLVLLFLLNSVVLHGLELHQKLKDAIVKAWELTQSWLIWHADSSIQVDFGWEPVPTHYRFGNFVDTTTYFSIMEIARLLKILGLVEKEKFVGLIQGLGYDIKKRLLHHTDIIPGVRGHEEIPGITELVFPHPSESVAHKGALMSGTIIELYRS